MQTTMSEAWMHLQKSNNERQYADVPWCPNTLRLEDKHVHTFELENEKTWRKKKISILWQCFVCMNPPTTEKPDQVTQMEDVKRVL